MSDAGFEQPDRAPADARSKVARPAERPQAALLGDVEGMLLELQRAAGNTAVVELLQRQPEEEPPPGPGTQSSVAARAKESEAELEQPEELDEFVPTGGGGYPVAPGFGTAGRVGSVPFGDAAFEDRPAGKVGGFPHAFVGGGRSGTRAWAGGAGAGPKGNQESGSIQKQVLPVYDSEMGGIFSNANAWVVPGTGELEVVRDYVTSDPGDQGNGWYVTAKAAEALDKHEQRHVKKSEELHGDKLQPVLDRVAKSADLGRGKVYRQRDAKTYLKRMIGWERGVTDFNEMDQMYNGNGGNVDVEDQASGSYPERYQNKKVEGKDYSGLLKLPGEPFPAEEAPDATAGPGTTPSGGKP